MWRYVEVPAGGRFLLVDPEIKDTRLGSDHPADLLNDHRDFQQVTPEEFRAAAAAIDADLLRATSA